jgi:hypothetical protein
LIDAYSFVNILSIFLLNVRKPKLENEKNWYKLSAADQECPSSGSAPLVRICTGTYHKQFAFSFGIHAACIDAGKKYAGKYS